MAQVRKLFTNDEILEALAENPNQSEAARVLSAARQVTVTPQLLRYWAKQLSYKKKEFILGKVGLKRFFISSIITLNIQKFKCIQKQFGARLRILLKVTNF